MQVQRDFTVQTEFHLLLGNPCSKKRLVSRFRTSLAYHVSTTCSELSLTFNVNIKALPVVPSPRELSEDSET